MKYLTLMYPSDGSVVFRVPVVLPPEKTGYRTDMTIIAGVFQNGPEVVLWSMSDLYAKTEPVDSWMGDYVVDAFGGRDAMDLAVHTFYRIRFKEAFSDD